MKLCMPWNNLGCLGVKVGGYYMDIFRRPHWGMFISTPYGKRRFWFWGTRRQA